MSKDHALEEAKRVMAALVREPPKPNEEMKLGKPRGKQAKKPQPRKKQP